MSPRAWGARPWAGPPGPEQEAAIDPSRPPTCSPLPGLSSGPPNRSCDAGALSLEAVLVLPILALLVVVLLQVAALVTDLLVLHEAARAGARTAATTSGSGPVVTAAKEAAPELPDLTVQVSPTVRGDGDLVRVEVRVTRSVGPVAHRLEAVAHARVEPAVGTTRRGIGP